MQSVILLISGDTETATVRELRTSFPVVQVGDVRSALKALREGPFSLVILDPRAAEDMNSQLLARAVGLAPLLEIDLRSTPGSIVARRAYSAICRSETEQLHARNAAIAHLQGELRDSLTGLLLESQLVLEEVDASKHPRLVNIVRNVKGLSARLKLEIEIA